MARRSSKKKKNDVELDKVQILGFYPWQISLVVLLALGMSASVGFGFLIYIAPDPDLHPPDAEEGAEPSEAEPEELEGIPVRRAVNPQK